MVQLELALVYALDVPADKAGTEGGASRYGCCHKTEEQGHDKTCGSRTRAHHIEKTLERAGIGFARLTHRDEVLVRTAAIEVSDEERQWLAEFLNLAPHIDPHDDEEDIVKMLAPFAALIRTCVEVRDRRAEMDVKTGNEEEEEEEIRKLPQFPGGELPEGCYESPETRKYGHPDSTPGETTSAFRERTGAEPPDDPVNHPRHYNMHPAGIECVDVTEHMTANIAAAMKYMWRAGLKPSADHDEDLAKAVWYIERERGRVRRLQPTKDPT